MTKGFGQISIMFLVVLLFALGITIYLVSNKTYFKPRAAEVISHEFSVYLGPEEYVAGPVENYLDNSFFVIPTLGGFKGFSANNKTFSFFGNSLDTIKFPQPTATGGIVLSAGQKGVFDECGAWLQTAWKETENHWIGWYHAEDKCNYLNNGQTHKSMAFTESFDSGKTWVKTGYPKNQIITADNSLAGDPATDDAGDAKIVPGGEYFYAFFLTSDYKWNVARSKLEDRGRPGTWWKYFNGSFTEPGIGGKSTPINSLNGLTYNRYLGAHLTVDTFGKWGFFLRTAWQGNIFNWEIFPYAKPEKSIYPQVSFSGDTRVDKWFGRTPTDKQIYAYPSVINSDGDIFNTDKDFYIYYVKIFDGESLEKNRYLLRRKITLNKGQSQYPARAALVRYDKLNKTRVSTEISKPSESYKFSTKVGSLLTYPDVGFRPLYDCYIPAWDDYMVSPVDPSERSWQHCESDGDTFVRLIGWAAQTPLGEANIPIYRCFDKPNLNHFLSRDSNCEGKIKEFLIGYIFP